MNCEEMRVLLSDYVDGVLDPKTKVLVDEHLSACKACQAELASLKALVHELGSLESVAPPSDFLDQLHERMEQRSPFSKILRTLFVPMRLKVPLELAGAAAMAVLVLSLFSIQQDRFRAPEAPVSITQEQVSEKASLESSHQGLKDEAFKPQRAYRTATAEKPLQKKEPIELALVVRRALPLETPGPGAAMQAAPAPNEKVGGMAAKTEAALRVHPEADESDNDLLLSLTGIVERVGGAVVSVEYEKDSNKPLSIHAEIPSGHLTTLYNRLCELGDLQSVPRAATGNEQGVLPVRIRLLSPSR
jgi:hypothetical protein